jgi:tetratricopeptide (TPR) repeat protein
MKSTLRAWIVSAAIAVAMAAAVGTGRLAGWGQDDVPHLTLRMIVVSSMEAAGRVAARLEAGESFVTVAKAESTDRTADQGGWLGRQTLGDLRGEVRRALEGVTPGHLSPVVRIPTGFAIFKVEPDEAAVDGAAERNVALAASGAVKFVFDVSGVPEERAGFEPRSLTPGWDLDARVLCGARTKARATSRAKIEKFLAEDPDGKVDPLDVVQLYFSLGQLHAYDGQMDAAVTWFEKGSQVAEARFPASVPQMQQALGIARLHKAHLDSHIPEAPGDFCLLGIDAGRPYSDTADAQKSVDHLLKFLDLKPDDLEARWLLNLAYRELGTYPAAVPARYLIAPTVFASAEDVGRFRDVAKAAGLDNVASAGGLIVDDFDNDGDADVVTSTLDSCAGMRLFANNGDGTFTDRTAGSGLDTKFGGLNMVRGDYNNDGCVDVLVLRGGWDNLPQRKSLLRNNCDGTFTDVTVASGLGAPTTTQTAAWTDFDNDGQLDLFVGVENAPAQLFRNKGDGPFDEVAAAAGVNRMAYTKGVTAIDYDNDRYPDLFVSNFGERNFLYHNNRNGTFTEFSEAARVLGTQAGFATWFFDYDNDGLPDLFVTSYIFSIDEMVRDYLGMPHNATTMKLYRNLGDGTFRDVTVQAGLSKVLMPMGSNFGDIDNDGFLDIYLGTGNPSYASLAPSVLLRNKEGKRFVDVTTSSGTGELHKGHGVAFADLDNDGDQEIVFEVGGATPGDRHALRLFENPGHGNDWIAVKLVGVKSNRGAVGARIKVTVTAENGTRTMYRTVGAGGSFGVSPLMEHIGLGKAARKVDLEVWWPTSDTRQQFTNVTKNSWLQIKELSDTVTPIQRTQVRLGGRTTP